MKKNQVLQKTYVFLSAVFILTLHLPLVSANTRPHSPIDTTSKSFSTYFESKPVALTATEEFMARAAEVYESLELDLKGLSRETYDIAMKGFGNLVQKGRFAKDNIISIVDLSMPSTKKRLFILDIENAKVLFNTYVAHGRNSGTVVASDFSNVPESFKSSLGFYETLQTYSGGHGYSLKLEGLEKGINDNAQSRAIVMHGAAYVNESLIRSQGYIGRSYGCPAVPENLYVPIINTIKNGTCLFIYGQNKSYLSKSKILNA